MDKINNTFTVESLDFFGNGIIHDVEGKCIFVKNALPGEEVSDSSLAITESKKRYSRAVISEVLQPSPHRIDVDCEYFSQCGGCQFRHCDYETEIKAKETHLRRLLGKTIGEEDVFRVFFGVVPAFSRNNYRNHAVFHMHGGKACFYRENSHDYISIRQCPLLHSELNSLLKTTNNIDNKKVKELDLRCDNTGHLVSAADDNADKLLTYDICGVQLNVPANGFFQVNTEMAEVMLSYVKALTDEIDCRRLLDLYCGVGTIGIISGKGRDISVTGIEVVPSAVEQAQRNAQQNGIKAQYYQGKTEDELKKLLNKLLPQDMVIIDPPRQGLQNSTAKILSDYAADHLIYVSCDPATLCRDLKTLLKIYKIKSVKAFDLFPGTSHVETVVLMSRVRK